MALPVVTIVGRPNVGKSSLLNALAGRMISIVDPTAGVTRDRISAVVAIDDSYFELVDTGGYGIEDSDNLTAHVEDQIRQAIDSAALVLFVVDIREGVTALDQKVAQLLRRINRKVILIANKADSRQWDNMAGEFYKLGFGEPICISAHHRRNHSVLTDCIVEHLRDYDTSSPPTARLKLAIVGKRNVGKSTFINSLTGQKRMIVSEVPGTTRDAVDVRIEKDGHELILIDTAGVQKKKKMAGNDIAFYSYTRATRSVKRADVVLLFLDAQSPISQVDKKLARFISESHKPCIIVINKWDLVQETNRDIQPDDYAEYLDKTMPGLNYAPVSFITAKQGKNTLRLLDLAMELYKQSSTIVKTSVLNQALQDITGERAPSARRKVGLPRIYYGTQVATNPPTLLLFVNKPSAIDENYQKFLINRLRELLPFAEVPIRLLLRHHRKQDETE